MNTKNSAVLERTATAFQQLAAAASHLNVASDELGRVVAWLESAIRRLNLGVSAWVVIDCGEDAEGEYYWSQELGYDRIHGNWGVALRTRSGNHTVDEPTQVERWLFNDAPRSLRLKGIDKIPNLIDALIGEAATTTDRIKAKTAEAKQLAAALEGPARSASPRK